MSVSVYRTLSVAKEAVCRVISQVQPPVETEAYLTFDDDYQIRDIYYPFVGQENHTGGSPCRFGVWSPLLQTEQTQHDRRKRRLYWTDQGWDLDLDYDKETMATRVHMQHDSCRCN